MREAKKHWWRWASEGKGWQLKGNAQIQVPLCNCTGYPKFANKKRSVSCKSCAKILAGYQGEVK